MRCCANLRRPAFRVLAALVLSGALSNHLRADQPPDDPWPGIGVPEEFVIERVAEPPLVQHPMMAGFDDQGRLYVAESAGMNLNFDELTKDPPNSIRMLEDLDGDGRFDKCTTFADKMTFPMGALWHKGALYVASPPNIWRLEDTDGDGVADDRKAIVGTFGSTGNAADVHGCFLGPEGRIYWCDGRHGHEFVDKDGKPLSKGLAARVFSCRPDGSDIRVFCGGGMDNPVEVAFTAEGEMLGTMTFYNPDDARHDALVHFVHGGVYPRKHDCTREFKRTGELMPALSLFGVTAPAGLMRYEGTQLGDEFADNAFSAHFNTHKIVRHVLSRAGASFTSTDEDFLVSDDADFHPTDVLQDADGSLLVIDTGGWFRIGCPTSQIAKPEIPGAIYRVRRRDAKPIADPRGLALDWSDGLSDADLAARLGDDRPAVAARAIIALAARGNAATKFAEGVKDIDTLDARTARNLVGALANEGSPASAAAACRFLDAQNPSVRQAAIHASGALRTEGAVSRLCEIVLADALQLRREAATALGRIGYAQAVPHLLESLRTGEDRFLEHALIYALIEINDRASAAARPEQTGAAAGGDTPADARAATLLGLSDPSPVVRRGALIALDQMNAGSLTRDQVTPLLDTDDIALRQAALEVLARHPGWSAEILGLLNQWLDEIGDPATPRERQAMVRGALLTLGGDAQVQSLVGAALLRDETPVQTRLLLLECIARTDQRPLPPDWTGALAQSLAATDPGVLRQAVITVATTGTQAHEPRLAEIGRDEALPGQLRVDAIAALAKGGARLEPAAFELLVNQLRDEVAPVERLAAASALSSAHLYNGQLLKLAPVIAGTGPLELRSLVEPYRRSVCPTVGRRLITSLEASPGLSSLTVAAVEGVLAGYSGDVRSAAQPLLARLSANTAAQRERLAEFESHITEGDLARGKEIFFGKRAACAACHKCTGEGGNVGPDLSRIGEIRTRRDLLEAMLFPSASLARGYESLTIVTDDGRTLTGVVGRETSEAIYLRMADRSEARVGRDEITELAPSPLSIMPQGLEKTVTAAELGDLLAYLRSLRP